jgi:hypothetical protein
MAPVFFGHRDRILRRRPNLCQVHNIGRPFVQYEIKQSHDLRKGLFGIYIHKLSNFLGCSDIKGDNPFDKFHINDGFSKKYLSEIYPIYDWISDDGYHNIGDWIEKAAKKAGR